MQLSALPKLDMLEYVATSRNRRQRPSVLAKNGGPLGYVKAITKKASMQRLIAFRTILEEYEKDAVIY